MQDVQIGQTLTCAQTGKQFVATRDGCSFNYAHSVNGELLSDEGVHLREREALANRAKPFMCYLSSDGQNVTGWKGNIHGTVTRESVSRNGWHGSKITSVRVLDAYGNHWHGRGAGRGMCITLRACK